MRNRLTAVSIFSGCGGFDWGAQQAGIEIIWANDIDPHAASAYKSLFPKIDFELNDIRNVHKFPAADVLIGCYPCTGFSLASRRRWRDRNQRDLKNNNTNFLYQEFLRVLKEVNPKYLFVENVKGMRSANGGWFLNEQLNGFRDAGYRVPDIPPLLNSVDYGVPQTRQRIFIAGVRKDVDFEYIYPVPSHGPNRAHPHKSLEMAIGHMDKMPIGEFFDYRFHGHYLTRNRKRGWKDPSYTIVADAHHIPLHPMGKPMKYVEKDTWILQGNENRRLSWRECAVIQGIPESIEIDGVLKDKYRVVGNAVPPALGRALVQSIVDFET